MVTLRYLIDLQSLVLYAHAKHACSTIKSSIHNTSGRYIRLLIWPHSSLFYYVRIKISELY